MDGLSCYCCVSESGMCDGYGYGFGMCWNMAKLSFECYLNCSNIFPAGLSCQFISAKALPNILLQTGFNGNLSTLASVAMTNSFSLVNLLNIIAFCSFDKSIMSWFTYALGNIFIGAFYTKLSLVLTNKASGGGLMLMVAFNTSMLPSQLVSQNSCGVGKSTNPEVEPLRFKSWITVYLLGSSKYIYLTKHFKSCFSLIDKMKRVL